MTVRLSAAAHTASLPAFAAPLRRRDGHCPRLQSPAASLFARRATAFCCVRVSMAFRSATSAPGVGPVSHHAIERGQRNFSVLAVQRGGEQFVGGAQAGCSGERRALHLRVTGNDAESTFIRQSGERDPAHAIGSRALRNHRHAPDVRQQAGGCRGFGVSTTSRASASNRSAADSRTSRSVSELVTRPRTTGSMISCKGRRPDLGIGVVLRQRRELAGVTPARGSPAVERRGRSASSGVGVSACRGFP